MTQGFDDSVNYLKHGLCQIEVNRLAAIGRLYDRDQHIPKGAMPDIWEPLRTLAHSLLPHLTFEGIDTTKNDQIRCTWRVHSKDITVDLDDLSSGEKSIIQMFYPVIEHRIKSMLQSLVPATNKPAVQDLCVLIDEPELHLHPNLQAKVMDYLRVLSADEHTQVIVATHSPNIVEYANHDELFLLRPIEMIAEGENQLVQVAENEDKLRFLRQTFGTTANLTAFQTVVIVEGRGEEQVAKLPTDRRLYRALHPGFDRVTIVPCGGKSECIRLRTRMKDALGAFTDRLKVVALLDRDLSVPSKDESLYCLPVAMIENWFLDPECIWDAIESVVDKTTFKSAVEVSVSAQ